MTTVIFDTKEVPAGIALIMKVHGHAEYAEHDDIVCSACSMLVQALAESLRRMRPAAWPMIYSENPKDASATVWYLAKDALEAERATSMFTMARAGFDLLAKNYPENVCVSGENGILC